VGWRWQVGAVGAAGLQAVAVAGVENVDVSWLLHQHWKIPDLLPELLELLELC
jgi:hypothetical protein